MKRISLLLFCMILMIACKQKAPEVKTIEVSAPQKIVLNPENLVKNELLITGMTCAIGCAATIEKKLNATPGIESAKVNFEGGIAQVVFDPNWIQDQELNDIVKGVGAAYQVTQNERVTSFSELTSE